MQLCNRTVCKKPNALWWNTSTRRYYCEDCARRINLHNPGLCIKLKEAPDAKV